MIAAGIYLERWSHDTDPSQPWCAVDIERIKAIQVDAMESVLRMVANKARNTLSPVAKIRLDDLCGEIERAIESTKPSDGGSPY